MRGVAGSSFRDRSLTGSSARTGAFEESTYRCSKRWLDSFKGKYSREVIPLNFDDAFVELFCDVI